MQNGKLDLTKRLKELERLRALYSEEYKSEYSYIWIQEEKQDANTTTGKRCKFN